MRMRRMARLAREEILNYYHYGYRFAPTNLCIETTTVCNAACVYCARFKSDLPGPHMDFGLFKAVVDASSDFITEKIMPYSRGEPLMYPHIVEAVQYITDSGHCSKMYSNGLLMNEQMARSLLDAGINELSFSIDENDGAKFEALRGISWDRVLSNVERLVAIRDEMGAKCVIVTRGCVGPFNIDRIRSIKEFWEARVDEVRFMPLLPTPGKEAMENQPIYNLPPYECSQTYLALNVRLNGEIAFCCNDWHNQLLIGKVDKHVTKRDILEIYNGRQMSKMRHNLEFGKGAPLLCAYCQSTRRSVRMWEQLADLGIERGKPLSGDNTIE